jgi:DNA processing protein
MISGGDGSAVNSLACEDCLRRTWLLGRLSGHINRVRRILPELLAATDDQLIRATAGKALGEVLAEYQSWGGAEADAARKSAHDAGLELICRCQEQYPERLLTLHESAPRVLHVAGGMERFLSLCQVDPVAIVGARRCTNYGRKVAYELSRDVSGVGVTIVSGMAAGIDSAAHQGALAATGNTIAVMPGGANLSYPVTASNLHGRIIGSGAAISELGPGTTARAWSFRARNRIIVALSAAVVVVQALPDSGSMRTATVAMMLGRELGAVPGHIETEASEGPHTLIANHDARLIGSSRDVLDLIGLPASAASVGDRSDEERLQVTEPQREILARIAAGDDTAAAIATSGIPPADILKGLAQLELMGWIRQGPGGQFRIRRSGLS